jgi:tetratricopeptide (TPR) repeat protein
MIVDRNRSRCKSHKRKKTVSVERDDNSLIRLLDERAGTAKKVVVSLNEINELRMNKENIQEIKAKFERDRKNLGDQLEKVKISKKILVQENLELKGKVNELMFKLNGNFEMGVEKEDLGKIKDALAHLEKVVHQRAENAKKMLSQIHKLLANHAKILLDQTLMQTPKLKLTEGIKKISETTSELEKLLIGQTLSPRPKLEETSDFYKQALEKMKTQTLRLKEKLKELESAEGLKRVIIDQESRIEGLIKDKEILKDQIWQLKAEVSDQHLIIEELKNITKRSETLSAKSSPSKAKSYLEQDENDIQLEIVNLDSEIQQLQNSLKRALVHT